MRGRNVVLAGATGFIGTRLRPELVERGFCVRATSRTGGPDVAAIDLTARPGPLVDLLSDPPADAVLQLAAAGVDGDSARRDPRVATDTIGTARELDVGWRSGTVGEPTRSVRPA